MNQQQAESVASALGGRVWQSGGNVWLVRFDLPDGRVSVISDDMACEYPNEAAMELGSYSESVDLA